MPLSIQSKTLSCGQQALLDPFLKIEGFFLLPNHTETIIHLIVLFPVSAPLHFGSLCLRYLWTSVNLNSGLLQRATLQSGF